MTFIKTKGYWQGRAQHIKRRINKCLWFNWLKVFMLYFLWGTWCMVYAGLTWMLNACTQSYTTSLLLFVCFIFALFFLRKSVGRQKVYNSKLPRRQLSIYIRRQALKDWRNVLDWNNNNNNGPVSSISFLSFFKNSVLTEFLSPSVQVVF